jgi:CBS domain-containing protein
MQSVREVMTKSPVAVDADAPVLEAARRMRDDNIGNVIITRQGRVHGILTDRDIVVRCLAERNDISTCKCGEICSAEVITVGPDDSIEQAISLMRKHAIRRLIVADQDRPVGVVSIGDLAKDRDRRSALGDISAAPPNQ